MERYKEIDLKTWKRRSHYLFYKDYEKPYFSLTSNLNVSELLSFSKKNKLSFFLLCLYCSCRAMDKVDAFKLRIINDKLRLYKHTIPSSTIINKDNTFSFALFEAEKSLNSFINKGLKVIETASANTTLTSIDHIPNVVYYSVIPWVSFTSFTNAHNKGVGEDIPRIVFGKYFNEANTTKMPVAVEVHHALIDGYDVGLYYKHLQEEMDNITI